MAKINSLLIPINFTDSKKVKLREFAIINPFNQSLNNQHFFAFALSLSQPNSVYNSNSPNGIELSQALNASTTDLYKTGFNLTSGYGFNNGFELHTGLHLDNYVSRINHTYQLTSIDSILSEQANYILNVDGSKTFFPGYVEQTTTDSRTVQHFNHEVRIGLSLGVGFHYHLGEKLVLRSIIKGIYQPVNFVNGRTIDQNLVVTSEQRSLNKNLLQAEAIGQLGYDVSRKIELFFSGHFRSDLNSSYNSIHVTKNVRAIGLSSGLRIHLNR